MQQSIQEKDEWNLITLTPEVSYAVLVQLENWLALTLTLRERSECFSD